MKHTVMVWDKPYEVSTHQKSKSVWVASGSYMGKCIQTQDRSQATAIARWREAARYAGNDGPAPNPVS